MKTISKFALLTVIATTLVACDSRGGSSASKTSTTSITDKPFGMNFELKRICVNGLSVLVNVQGGMMYELNGTMGISSLTTGGPRYVECQ